jgi:FAD-dependent oxidoreductase domain-containing protein 1
MTSKIAIIGGGPMGLCTAYHLARKGLASGVVVIERDMSYRRCSALLSAGGVRQQFSQVENILMSKDSVDFIQEMNKKYENINFKPNGYMFLSSSEEGEQILRENNKTQRECGVDWIHTTTVKSEMRSLYPWLNIDNIRIASYSYQTKEGYFDPWSLIQAIRQECKDMGVNFLEADVVGANSKQIDTNLYTIDSLMVRNKQGDEKEVKIDQCINTAGAWSEVAMRNWVTNCGGNDDFFHLPVERRKRCIFQIHCPGNLTGPEFDAYTLPPITTPLTIDANTGVYFRAEGNAPGNYICGVSPTDDKNCENDDVLDNVDHDLFEEIIWSTLAELVPKFNELKVVSSWSGYYDYNTLDQNAILGIHPNFQNIYICTGFSGHGLQMAPAAGKAMAELIVDKSFQSIDLTKFGVERIVEKKPYYETGIV